MLRPNNLILCLILPVLICLVSTSHLEGQSKVTISLTDGTSREGELETIDETGSVSGKDLAGIQLADIVSINTNNSISAFKRGATIIPASGGVLLVDRPICDGDSVSFQSGVGLRSLPLQAIRAVVWKDSPVVQKAVANPSLEFDQMVVQSKDSEIVLNGLFERIDETHLHLSFKGQSRKILLEKMIAVITADLDLKQPNGPQAKITCSDGSSINGVVQSLQDGDLRLKLIGTESASLPMAYISQVMIQSDRVRYLSDLDPVNVEEKPVFGVHRGWKRDQSVGGNPIQFATKADGQRISFGKGIGTQSFSSLVFDVDVKFDRLAAVVGIDAETNGRGDCRMVILGDDVELWSKRVKASDDPTDLDIDISGVKRIALVVYPGEEFDLGDHVNWADARLIRTR